MDKSLKLAAIAIAALAVICIVIFGIIFIWSIIHVPANRSSSLDFRYYDDSQPYSNHTQYTQNGTFTGHMHVGGSSDTMLILLQDYNVTAFHYNGSVNTTHMIARNVYFNESNYVTPIDTAGYNDTFAISGIPDGFHDVEFVGFVDPYNYTGNNALSDGPFSAGGVRFNVIVNNSTKTIPPYTDSALSNDTLYSHNYSFGGPVLTKEPFSSNYWPRENANGGSVVDYYVNMGSMMWNDNLTGYSFAIVPLLDYEQIPIRVGSPDTVYYGHVDKNMFTAVHMSLMAPDEAGLHKLAVIVITSPYQDLEVAPYVFNNQTWTNNREIIAATTVEHQDINVL
jgi:hypothetical protein